MKLITIRKGRRYMTGLETKSGWTLFGTEEVVMCENLKQVKSLAVNRGASGKWRREVRPVGVRGRGVVHYYDAEAKQ